MTMTRVDQSVEDMGKEDYMPTIYTGLSCENADWLLEKVPELQKVLEEIARSGKDGICTYGCDLPNVAQEGLNRLKGLSSATKPPSDHGRVQSPSERNDP